MIQSDTIQSILLEMLEAAFQPADVTATQQMGVQLSSAVKREGVVIIQNQNVEVYARIVPLVAKALRLCNAIGVMEHDPHRIPPDPLALTLKSADPITDACAVMFERGFKWEEMQEVMRTRYVEYVLGRFKTKREAAEMLGIGSTYLSRIIRPIEDSREVHDD